MRILDATLRAAGTLALVITTAGACSSPADLDPVQRFDADALQARVGSGIVFISTRIVPDASMDALFEGQVHADEQGCLRQDSDDRHTVVWPNGYDFDAEGGTIRILDADGDLVGRIGESFVLGGGEVTSLPEELGFTEADRELAEAHCPGRYWIVGED